MSEHLDGYRVFYQTALAGSFTKAADALFITQPAVTQAIKQLETRLGGQLFFRTSKGVRLTAEGEMLFRYIGEAFHLLDEGERRLADMHQLISGEIKIGAGDTLCKHVLLPYLRQFHEEYPGVRIQVANRTTPETVALLKAGRIDLGLVNLPVADKQLEVRPVLEIQDIFAAGAGTRFASLAAGPLDLEELVSHPVLMLEKGSNTRDYLDGYASAHGVSIKPEIELGSLDLLAEFARAGFGIVHLIREFARHELETGELLELPVRPPVPPRRVGVIHLREVPLPSAARELIRRLPSV